MLIASPVVYTDEFQIISKASMQPCRTHIIIPWTLIVILLVALGHLRGSWMVDLHSLTTYAVEDKWYFHENKMALADFSYVVSWKCKCIVDSRSLASLEILTHFDKGVKNVDD